MQIPKAWNKEIIHTHFIFTYVIFIYDFIKMENCRYNKTASLIAQLVKSQPAMWETPIGFLGGEDLLEKG